MNCRNSVIILTKKTMRIKWTVLYINERYSQNYIRFSFIRYSKNNTEFIVKACVRACKCIDAPFDYFLYLIFNWASACHETSIDLNRHSEIDTNFTKSSNYQWNTTLREKNNRVLSFEQPKTMTTRHSKDSIHCLFICC